MFKRIALATLLTVALASVIFAQPPAGGRRGRETQPPGPPQGAPGIMMFTRGGPMSLLFLATNPQVQQELKLTEEQREKVSSLRQQLGEKFRGLGLELRKLPPEEALKRTQEIREEVEKELAKILEEKQLKRLKQIELQVEGLAALARPEVAEKVGLNEKQRQRVREIVKEAFEKRRALSLSSNRQAIFQEMQKIRQWVDEEINKLLTEEQKKRWQKLIGEPFKLEFQPFGGRRRQ